ncbi:DnaJ homolog subfamily B member 12 [Durusdinium trenchii]|uniref:DnaJ homolog subfamily B member 12 n=1 Tax=Durusdinium trenchii TaxID=1381693 RepID=A0ABP0RSU3_9DINO
MGAESKLSAEAAARFVLGLSQGCSKEDVKRAFRRLALVFHPDKNKGQNEEEATKRFQAIATAKDLLLGTCLSGTARPGPPVAKKPSVVVHWVCGACQAERHLNTFKVCIRHSGGKNLHLEASPGETVKDLKRRLEESWGILSKEQRLLCRGALMVDERSLGSYDLQVDGAVIVFAPQLRLRQANGTKSRGPGKVMPYDAARGFLMVPGLEKWRPETAGKTNVEEADLFFDSQKSPAPWQIRSRDFTQVR